MLRAMSYETLLVGDAVKLLIARLVPSEYIYDANVILTSLIGSLRRYIRPSLISMYLNLKR